MQFSGDGTAASPFLIDDAPEARIKISPQVTGLGTIDSPCRFVEEDDTRAQPSNAMYEILLNKIRMELKSELSKQQEMVAWRLVYEDDWYPRSPDELARFCRTLDVKVKAWQHGQEVYRQNMIAKLGTSSNF